MINNDKIFATEMNVYACSQGLFGPDEGVETVGDFQLGDCNNGHEDPDLDKAEESNENLIFTINDECYKLKEFENGRYNILFVTGFSGSGKTTLGGELSKKYHCNLIMDEQMKCIKCKYPLSLDIKNNILICLQCHFQTDPSCILWKCFKCGQEFHSGAKIYNPYEYKPLALAIKKSMFDKINAAPPILKCGHSSQGIKHKADCNGDLYVAQLNERKMVLCSKCNALIKYEKFIWICPVCNERSRDDGSLASLQSKSITPNVDAMKIINKRNQTFRNSSYKNPNNNTVNFSLKNSYNILHSQRDSDGSSKIKT